MPDTLPFVCKLTINRFHLQSDDSVDRAAPDRQWSVSTSTPPPPPPSHARSRAARRPSLSHADPVCPFADFNAFTQQGWVSSGFILSELPAQPEWRFRPSGPRHSHPLTNRPTFRLPAQTAFLLIFGQVLRIWPAKYVLLTAILIFEVGSAVCGKLLPSCVLLRHQGLMVSWVMVHRIGAGRVRLDLWACV